MSQLSELLKEMKPDYIDARLEAISIITTELLDLLSTEQREKLIESAAIRRPEIEHPTAPDAKMVKYQLNLLLSLSQKLPNNKN